MADAVGDVFVRMPAACNGVASPSPFLEARSNRPSVTPDQRTLVVSSRLNNALYSYSLPDLMLLGGAYLSGRGAAWVTVTPDGKRAYVADLVGNNTLVVDVPSMKEVAKIAVGQVPKRNYTMAVRTAGSGNEKDVPHMVGK
jgi:YVTN family beta-propeller protein